jgi:uncharacterized membrane protein
MKTRNISLFREFQKIIIANENVFTAILAVVYIVGLLGFIYQKNVFIQLTPLLLVFNFVLLFLFQPHSNNKFLRFSIFVIVVGYVVEMLGVSTGKIFGEYEYGETLGKKLNNTPLLIGINWLVLAYTSAQLSHQFSKNNLFVKALFGGTLMLLVDFFIEIVAPKLDFWYWKEEIVPIQNYIAWFVIGSIFNYIYLLMGFEGKNKIASKLFIIQLIFFVLLSFKFSSKKYTSAPKDIILENKRPKVLQDQEHKLK